MQYKNIFAIAAVCTAMFLTGYLISMALLNYSMPNEPEVPVWTRELNAEIENFSEDQIRVKLSNGEDKTFEITPNTSIHLKGAVSIQNGMLVRISYIPNRDPEVEIFKAHMISNRILKKKHVKQ